MSRVGKITRTWNDSAGPVFVIGAVEWARSREGPFTPLQPQDELVWPCMAQEVFLRWTGPITPSVVRYDPALIETFTVQMDEGVAAADPALVMSAECFAGRHTGIPVRSVRMFYNKIHNACTHCYRLAAPSSYVTTTRRLKPHIRPTSLDYVVLAQPTTTG